MGVTKTEGFTAEQNKRATIYKALGHPARIAIIDILLRRQSCICNDLVEELPLAQPTVSQHLRELKEVGLIKGEIEGTSICYCINEVVWNEIKAECVAMFNAYKDIGKCC